MREQARMYSLCSLSSTMQCHIIPSKTPMVYTCSDAKLPHGSRPTETLIALDDKFTLPKCTRPSTSERHRDVLRQITVASVHHLDIVGLIFRIYKPMSNKKVDDHQAAVRFEGVRVVPEDSNHFLYGHELGRRKSKSASLIRRTLRPALP